MSEEYQKHIKKYLIEIPTEKAKISEYGKTEQAEKEHAKQVYQKIRERNKPPK